MKGKVLCSAATVSLNVGAGRRAVVPGPRNRIVPNHTRRAEAVGYTFRAKHHCVAVEANTGLTTAVIGLHEIHDATQFVAEL